MSDRNNKEIKVYCPDCDSVQFGKVEVSVSSYDRYDYITCYDGNVEIYCITCGCLIYDKDFSNNDY